MYSWKSWTFLFIVICPLSNSEIGRNDDFVFSSSPVPVSFISPESFMRFQPWNFKRYSKMEMQFNTREPMGIIFFVGTSSSTHDCIGLEIFHSNMYAFGMMLGKHFKIQLNPPEQFVSSGQFHTVSIQVLPTNRLIMEYDKIKISEEVPTPGNLEFDTYTYMGGIDSITRLPWGAYSQMGFSGCINYIRVNDDKFINVKEHSKLIEIHGSQTGSCPIPVTRCVPGICGPGKCFERSFNLLDSSKNFYCDCSGTFKSYSSTAKDILRGESCITDSSTFQCNTKSYILYSFEQERVTHFDHISLDFRTTSLKESLFLMKAGHGETITTFISAELISGRVLLILNLLDDPVNNKYKKIIISIKNNLNNGQWHTLKIRRYAEMIELYVDDNQTRVKETLYRATNLDRFFNKVKEILFGSVIRQAGQDKCTGELKNFYWNDEDLLGKRSRVGDYQSQVVTKTPRPPILPPFPRQPPISCSMRPDHQHTVILDVPLNEVNGIFVIELKTKYNGIIWKATSQHRDDSWMTLLIFFNTIYLAYNFESISGVYSKELTSAGLSIKDNTWHRVIVELNKIREFIYIYIDDIQHLYGEIRLPDSYSNQLRYINSMRFSMGGLSSQYQYQVVIILLRKHVNEIATSFNDEKELQFVGCMGELLINNDNFTGNLMLKSTILTYPLQTMDCQGCQEDMIKCPRDYCQNQGKCYNINSKKIACNCQDTNFHGSFCDIKNPTCDPNHCKNGGLCQIVENNRVCNCAGTGYEGFECEIHRCSNLKCLNGGVCVIKGGLPECDCSATNFEGVNCGNSKCSLHFCSNNGKCLFDISTRQPYCLCKGTGYYGSKCDQPICTPDICNKNGNCLVRNEKPVCNCNNDYMGETCNKLVCSKDECLNSGICTPLNGKPFCRCTDDFQGPRCENPKPCPTGYCLYGGICQTFGGIPKCDCLKTDYTGIRCETPKKCPQNYCENGGTCKIVANNFACDCSNLAYTGDRCTYKIGCPESYCKNGGLCKINNGKFSCDCSLTAYTGNTCEESTNGIFCDYKKPGYTATTFTPPKISEGIITSMSFQTLAPTGTLFCYETKDEKHWLINLIDGKLVVDINEMIFHMKTVVNDGQPHLIRVARDSTNFLITIDNPSKETLLIPTQLTSILTLPNNVIIYTKLVVCNSCPDPNNKDRFQGVIGNVVSGEHHISNNIRNGQGALIGSVTHQLFPMNPLPPIPITGTCQQNFCKNGGICKIKNYGPTCDCGLNGYTGEFCEHKMFILKSVPPIPGYVISNIVHPRPTSSGFLKFLVQMSNTSSPLLTLITSGGNSMEMKIVDGQLYLISNGNTMQPLNRKLLKPNVPHFIRLVNFLGRVTAYVNDTKFGHIHLPEPVIMANGSIQVSKFIIGANKNLNETVKGFIGDFNHNGFPLIGPTGLLRSSANLVQDILIQPWIQFRKILPDLAKLFNGTRGGILTISSILITAEGFGAGDLMPFSSGPIVMGANILGLGAAPVNPLILGSILALILAIIGAIWACGNFICHTKSTPALIPSFGTALKTDQDTGDLTVAFLPGIRTGMGTNIEASNTTEMLTARLLNGKSSFLNSSGTYAGQYSQSPNSEIKKENMNTFKSGRSDMDFLLGAQTYNTLDQDRSKALSLQNELSSTVTKLNVGFNNIASLESGRSVEKTQSGNYGYSFGEQNLASNLITAQSNVFNEGELKLDCCVLSNDSKYAITGSVNGPPQIWNLADGSVIYKMDGANQACDALELAVNNTILIGLITQNHHPLSSKMLMFWNFPSGQIIETDQEILCTSYCVSNDGKYLITADDLMESSLTILDLINDQKRQILYNRPDDMATDGIQLLKISQNFQFIVAGYQSLDNISCYMGFDMHKGKTGGTGIFKIKSNLNCCGLINNNEAIAGSESGELIIWNLETSKPVRHIVIPSTKGKLEKPHDGLIKCLTVSKDGSLLASGDVDNVINVWNMENETLLHTLLKHSDEVTSLVFSNDSEILVSASVDGSIRVWNVAFGDQLCCFSSNIEINKVLLSVNKEIIVALGERAGVNKLVMLQILRNIRHEFG